MCPRLVCPGEPRSRQSTPDVTDQGWGEEKDHLLWAVGNALTQQTGGLLCSKDTLLYSLSTSIPRDLHAELFSRWLAPACPDAWGYSSPGARKRHFHLMSFTSFFFSCLFFLFLQPVKVLLNSVATCWCQLPKNLVVWHQPPLPIFNHQQAFWECFIPVLRKLLLSLWPFKSFQ